MGVYPCSIHGRNDSMLRRLALGLSITLAGCGSGPPPVTPAPRDVVVPVAAPSPVAPPLVLFHDGVAIETERPCFPSGACFRIHGLRSLGSIDAAGTLLVEVGERGAAVETVAGVRSVIPAFTDSDLRDVWVRDDVEAWAVGDRIYRRTAQGWAAVECAEPGDYLAVHGDRASGRVVAIGEHTMTRVDEGRCETVEVEALLRDVWVEPGGRRAWAVGSALVQWADGAPEVGPGVIGEFVAGRAADDVWVTGSGITRHFDGQSWRTDEQVHARIEPAFVDGEPVVIRADGALRDRHGWRSVATLGDYAPPEWRLGLDIAIGEGQWVTASGSVDTAPRTTVESHWIDDSAWFDEPVGPTASIVAMAPAPGGPWIADGALHRVDDAGIGSWDPRAHFFYRRPGHQCGLARVTGVVEDDEGGVLAAAQGAYECPPVASLLHIDGALADREEWPLPYPIRELVRLPNGSVLGLAIARGEPALVVDRRGHVRRVRFPRPSRDTRTYLPAHATACATSDGRAWVVDDEFRFFRIDPGASRAVAVEVPAGGDSVTCDHDAAWVIGCYGRLTRCAGRRCVEIATAGETVGEQGCGDLFSDASPLPSTGHFQLLAHGPDGRFFTASGSQLYVRAADGQWQTPTFDMSGYIGALAFRGDRLVLLTQNGDLTEYPLATLPLRPLGSQP